MRAYNLAMAMIFINCGMMIAVAMGAFGDTTPTPYADFQGIVNAQFKIGLLEFKGADIIAVIAGVMILATALLLNSRAFSSEGVAIGVFTGIFWVSVGLTDVILLNSISNRFPGFNIFIGIYTLAAFLIFINALVQMPTGGQRSHV